MNPTITLASEKKLIGQRLMMSLANYKVGELWRGFRPRQNEIRNRSTTDLLSVSVYPPHYFENFNPANEFAKWAAVEVANFEHVPAGMEPLGLPGGLYAVFAYRGSSSDPSVFQFILGTWLPNSGYALDDRPHFEVLGEKYKNDDPTSEEEIWLPIKTQTPIPS
jgi:AraC family transcriptional regulator